jgi:tRNA(Ile)-lysidine synthase
VSPPSLATRTRRVLKEARVAEGAVLLVACSGGLDSQVLLDTLALVGKGGRLRLFAHGVDHGLRAAARDELDLARRLCLLRGVPFDVTTKRVPPGPNLQARARDVRYSALRSAAAKVGAGHVCTAHHLEDRAETVLIRILRGASLSGLSVLPAAQGDLLRPLVSAHRKELLAHAKRRGLEWADDPSNRDPRFLRVRVRSEVLPLLRALDPRIDEHLVDLAEEAISTFGPAGPRS